MTNLQVKAQAAADVASALACGVISIETAKAKLVRAGFEVQAASRIAHMDVSKHFVAMIRNVAA